MTMLYPNLCNIEVCYKGTSLYEEFYVCGIQRILNMRHTRNPKYEAYEEL